MTKKIFLLALGLLIVACEKSPPTQQDGSLVLRTILVDQSGLIETDPELGYAPLSNARAVLESNTYYESPGVRKKYVAYSDSQGVVEFKDLLLGRYTLTVEKEVEVSIENSDQVDTLTLRGSKLIEMMDLTFEDTLKANLALESSLVINEIYYCGPKNKAFYFYDQFIELYNNSDTTVYLDGLILCRGLQRHKPNMDSVDYVQVTYIFQFPGEPKVGREYPVAPHQYVVVAQDAIDHSQYIDTALDLSDADWEFYNPYGAEIDNPAPNVVNVLPERSLDFMINLVHNFVLLADGTDFYAGEVSDRGYQYYHVPIHTILDGVEYSSNPNSLKQLTVRIDAGFAGVGMSKYSGKSVQRRQPGFDTNNSSLDFIILDHPTPGY
ncbi:DUF4876 domain-containing protein [Caldithrix abyssi]|uniref:Lamin Tail Domain n=1 Tax=Caldithrix abyssi DSM 13497 TaxID=880073 RepID=H1XXJ9_CALAY|nr:DUF4876 domain-containing protein [Caldithrix abyssi]APF19212.1 Lamin Tail Domain [Caldithrix abyssi DSM 13497]EHO43123.1 hypothetical protein Calab_3524 [Caldithrix abyssi DSM 13497]